MPSSSNVEKSKTLFHSKSLSVQRYAVESLLEECPQDPSILDEVTTLLCTTTSVNLTATLANGFVRILPYTQAQTILLRALSLAYDTQLQKARYDRVGILVQAYMTSTFDQFIFHKSAKSSGKQDVDMNIHPLCRLLDVGNHVLDAFGVQLGAQVVKLRQLDDIQLYNSLYQWLEPLFLYLMLTPVDQDAILHVFDRLELFYYPVNADSYDQFRFKCMRLVLRACSHLQFRNNQHLRMQLQLLNRSFTLINQSSDKRQVTAMVLQLIQLAYSILSQCKEYQLDPIPTLLFLELLSRRHAALLWKKQLTSSIGWFLLEAQSQAEETLLGNILRNCCRVCIDNGECYAQVVFLYMPLLASPTVFSDILEQLETICTYPLQAFDNAQETPLDIRGSAKGIIAVTEFFHDHLNHTSTCLSLLNNLIKDLDDQVARKKNCSLLIHWFSGFLFHPDITVRTKSVQSIPAIVQLSSDLAVFLAPSLVYYLTHATQEPEFARECFYQLAGTLTCQRDCVPIALRIVSPMLAVPDLRALAIRLLLCIWKQESRVYPRLNQALVDVSQEAQDARDDPDVDETQTEELRLACATTIGEICEYRPAIGKDLIHVIQLNLVDSHPAVVACALNAVASLCREGSLDFYLAYKILFPKSKKKAKQPKIAHRDHWVVQRAVCTFFQHGGRDYDSYPSKGDAIIQQLWDYTSEGHDRRVRAAAWTSLGQYSLEAVGLVLPDDVDSEDEEEEMLTQEDIDERVKELFDQLYAEKTPDVRKAMESMLTPLVQLEGGKLTRMAATSAASHQPSKLAKDSKNQWAKTLMGILPVPENLYRMHTAALTSTHRSGLAGALLLCYSPDFGKVEAQGSEEEICRQYTRLLDTFLHDVSPINRKTQIGMHTVWHAGWHMFVERQMKAILAFKSVKARAENSDFGVDDELTLLKAESLEYFYYLKELLYASLSTGKSPNVCVAANAVAALEGLVLILPETLQSVIALILDEMIQIVQALVSIYDNNKSTSTETCILEAAYHALGAIAPLLRRMDDEVRLQSAWHTISDCSQNNGGTDTWAEAYGRISKACCNLSSSTTFSLSISDLEKNYLLLWRSIMSLMPELKTGGKQVSVEKLGKALFSSLFPVTTYAEIASVDLEVDLKQLADGKTQSIRSFLQGVVSLASTFSQVDMFDSMLRLYYLLKTLLRSKVSSCSEALVTIALRCLHCDLLPASEIQSLIEVFLELLESEDEHPDIAIALPCFLLDSIQMGTELDASTLTKTIDILCTKVKQKETTQMSVNYQGSCLIGLTNFAGLGYGMLDDYSPVSSQEKKMHLFIDLGQLREIVDAVNIWLQASNIRLRSQSAWLMGGIASLRYVLRLPSSDKRSSGRIAGALTSKVPKESMLHKLLHLLQEGDELSVSMRISCINILAQCRLPAENYSQQLRKIIRTKTPSSDIQVELVKACVNFACKHMKKNPSLSSFLMDFKDPSRFGSLESSVQVALITRLDELVVAVTPENFSALVRTMAEYCLPRVNQRGKWLEQARALLEAFRRSIKLDKLPMDRNEAIVELVLRGMFPLLPNVVSDIDEFSAPALARSDSAGDCVASEGVWDLFAQVMAMLPPEPVDEILTGNNDSKSVYCRSRLVYHGCRDPKILQPDCVRLVQAGSAYSQREREFLILRIASALQRRVIEFGIEIRIKWMLFLFDMVEVNLPSTDTSMELLSLCCLGWSPEQYTQMLEGRDLEEYSRNFRHHAVEMFPATLTQVISSWSTSSQGPESTNLLEAISLKLVPLSLALHHSKRIARLFSRAKFQLVKTRGSCLESPNELHLVALG